MVFLKIENEGGDYQDAEGKKYMVLWGDEIYQPGHEKNEGCEAHATLEEALEAHGLTKIETEEAHHDAPEAPTAE